MGVKSGEFLAYKVTLSSYAEQNRQIGVIDTQLIDRPSTSTTKLIQAATYALEKSGSKSPGTGVTGGGAGIDVDLLAALSELCLILAANTAAAAVPPEDDRGVW